MVWVVPLLHPSAISRGRWNDEPAQLTYVERWLPVALGRTAWQHDDITRPPPGSRLFPSLEQLRSFAALRETLTDPHLSVDTEEAGIYLICVGFTWLDLASGSVGPSLNLPLRLRGGRQAQRPEALAPVVHWLDSLLGDPTLPKVFHNATHDVVELERLGFEVAGPLWDTMVLAHLCYPELRKGLQFTATLYLGAPRWKHLVDEEDESEGKF